jgi:hypothetical protein
MSLPAKKSLKVVSLGDISGGLNINDPSISIGLNQVAGVLNCVILNKGFKAWCGCENITEKDTCNDYLRGLFNHSTIAGSETLFTVFGGKIYSINKSTGAVSSPLFDLTGQGEVWGASHWGKYYGTNGSKCFKIEGSTVYNIGITPPSSGSAAAGAGAGLPDGVYKVKIGYARKVSSLNVLYSTGYDLGSVTLGSGNNRVSITSFANSSDSQVNNKVVWMTDAAGETYWFYHETGDNTTTSITISATTLRNDFIEYWASAGNNGLPTIGTFLGVFDNRIGVINGNSLYYSLKATNGFDLERFPVLNKIDYPYQMTGFFTLNGHLFLNTANNGIIIQPNCDVSAKFEHIEQKESFAFIRTVADWRGGKIGLTKDKVGFFNGTNFEEWDYGYNVRPALNKIWSNYTSNTLPCGFTYRRDNRIEYALSFCDTTLGASNNNRTYVLNLSQTFFQDNVNYKTPWEVVDRGFNYVSVDNGNTPYYGQSFDASSTIFKDKLTSTTQKGIYNSVGEYLSDPVDMTRQIVYKTLIEDMFSKIIIDDIRSMFQTSAKATVTVVIADDPGLSITQDTNIDNISNSVWDIFEWDVDNWAPESQQMYRVKGDDGKYGYSWYFVFNQTADDILFKVTQFDILITIETGRGI